MRVRDLALALCVLALAACGQPTQDEAGYETGSSAPILDAENDADQSVELEPVDPLLVAAPPEDFVAIEPSEVGVFGAPTIMDSIHDLVSGEALEGEASVSLTIREEGDIAVVDIVRDNIPEDSVAAGHVRVEFRREPEGWFPTNAYRRWMCRRGSHANQWSKELCE
ncbi:hypothetical protein [Vitreimonas flagellata]|uniref:hypothetical protein n=1 Tax=Vitreimonas flagellata TaxID=2560861 RepID=UPI0010750785|nr:hypothetical protein [Vitreimonas flagellata]